MMTSSLKVKLPKATSKEGPTPTSLSRRRRPPPLGYEDEDAGKTKFGMFEGVSLRCLLNIWGVIMFLRMGWMVAHAGAWLASSIIVVLW